MKKVIALVAAMTSIFLLIAGCGTDNSSSNFPSGNQDFKAMQNDGYINAFDGKSDTHDGVTLRVEAIASDGLTTYVYISADGELPPGLVAEDEESPGLRLLDEDISDTEREMVALESPADVSLGSNHIVDATLENGSSNTWSFRKQTKLGRTGDQLSVLRPTLRDAGLKQNEDVLIFYNTNLSGTATFSLGIEIRGIKTKFVIDGLDCKIAPTITRDFSENNLYYEAAHADMQLLSAKSTYLETVFTIKWIVRPGFSNAFPLYTEHAIVFSWDESSISTFMFFPDDSDLGDEPVELISSHAIAGHIPLERQITVSLQYMPNNENVETMFVLPESSQSQNSDHTTQGQSNSSSADGASSKPTAIAPTTSASTNAPIGASSLAPSASSQAVGSKQVQAEQFLVGYPVKKITVLKFNVTSVPSLSDKAELVKEIDGASELSGFKKNLKKSAWTFVQDSGAWFKQSPSVPSGYVLFVEGEQGQVTILHLYSENGASVAQFNNLPLTPEQYHPFTEPLDGFDRYWVAKEAYQALYQLCS
ncbi:MAG: DUF4179 domain-containing protein [Oscillospiraceae bacterium]|jgi:hypothetical protein|nr:DUF4179 domain-containing protein [Oscillospiraceae bacterium]